MQSSSALSRALLECSCHMMPAILPYQCRCYAIYNAISNQTKDPPPSLFTSDKKRRIKAQGSGPFSPPESPKPKTRFTIDGVCVGFPRARTGETAHGSLEVGIFLGTVDTVGREEGVTGREWEERNGTDKLNEARGDQRNKRQSSSPVLELGKGGWSGKPNPNTGSVPIPNQYQYRTDPSLPPFLYPFMPYRTSVRDPPQNPQSISSSRGPD